MENMYEHGRRSIYPCQSTGLWYARSTPPTHAFLQGLHGYLRTRPNEWEQKAYQLLVMRYLIGLGDDARAAALPAAADGAVHQHRVLRGAAAAEAARRRHGG